MSEAGLAGPDADETEAMETSEREAADTEAEDYNERILAIVLPEGHIRVTDPSDDSGVAATRTTPLGVTSPALSGTAPAPAAGAAGAVGAPARDGGAVRWSAAA